MDSTLLIAIAAVFIVSIIFSMFGQGGGSLYTPILFLLGYATLTSISTSLVLNLITALSASIVYYRSNLVDIRFALWFVPGICLGAFLGGVITAYVNPVLLMWLFVIFLIGAGGRMIYTYWEKAAPEGACPVTVFQGDVRPHRDIQFLCRHYIRIAWCWWRDPDRAVPDIPLPLPDKKFCRSGQFHRHLLLPVRRVRAPDERRFRHSPDHRHCYCSRYRRYDRCEKHGEDLKRVYQGGFRGDPLGICDSANPQTDAYYINIHEYFPNRIARYHLSLFPCPTRYIVKISIPVGDKKINSADLCIPTII